MALEIAQKMRTIKHRYELIVFRNSFVGFFRFGEQMPIKFIAISLYLRTFIFTILLLEDKSLEMEFGFENADRYQNKNKICTI